MKMKISTNQLNRIVREETQRFLEKKELSMQDILLDKGTIRVGSSGAAVSQVQNALGLEVDGKFGPGTKKAVQDLQRKLGVKPDGVLGGATARKWLGIPANKRGKKGKQRAALMAGEKDLERLDSHLSTFSYVNEEEMEEIYNIIKKYKSTDAWEKALVDGFKEKTGDDLVSRIQNISGVEKYKKASLELLGAKYEKDLTTKAKELTPGKVFKKIQSAFTRFASNVPLGGDLHTRAFLSFMGWRNNPWTEKDMAEDEVKWIRNFLTNLTTGAYEKDPNLSTKTRQRLRQERRNWKKTGTFRFGDKTLGKAYSVYKAETNPEEETGIYYGQSGKPQSFKTLFVDPSKAAQMEKFLGQFTFQGNPESGFTIADHYDFNDFDRAKNDEQVEKVVSQRIDSLAQSAKDKDIYRTARNLAPLWAHYTNHEGFPVKIKV